ncbi:2-dehydro-3-deoxygalactonokinase [Ramlibacter henchirensis]|uniref:2-dehydro-3-deoxygalactonokinase n=1 Tax=Ramlibacter henchirensis TaxID=204072 RepID=A0A4Z0C3I0_9BURK|nr:2-dehydro-3-deoxygalactonokinase [Ramlibacter henchirensis]TFZ06237.1 2-dehydro-3-deoxygalactonokinase [Ramlibacter henchirensis]
MKTFIALDWGTSSLRAALLDSGGAVLEQWHSDEGILHVPAGGFPAAFQRIVQGWPVESGMLCLASGMVGSRQGWQEAPYCPCPAGPGELAGRIAWLPDAPSGARLGIAPGLCTNHCGMYDVMRGEEVQVFGALELLSRDSGTFVLPGTHSKWVRVRQGRIEAFSTFMTGEVYGLLRRHSILARTLPQDDGALDESAFLRGVMHARQAGSLLHGAFAARTASLFDQLAPAALPSYLSGLVIGEELRAQHLENSGAELVLVGAPALTQRYELALRTLGLHSSSLGDEATWRGLWSLAQKLEPA